MYSQQCYNSQVSRNISNEKPASEAINKAELIREKRIQVARHVLEIERGLEYNDLKQYVEEQIKNTGNESYGASLLNFLSVVEQRKQHERNLGKKNKVSLFDYFKGMPSFFRQMPASMHFYPKAKKLTQKDKLQN